MESPGAAVLIRLYVEEPMRPLGDYTLADFRKMYHQSNYWWAARNKQEDVPLTREVLWRTLDSMFIGPISPPVWQAVKDDLSAGAITEAEALETLYAEALRIRTNVGDYVAQVLGHADWAELRETYRREWEAEHGEQSE